MSRSHRLERQEIQVKHLYASFRPSFQSARPHLADFMIPRLPDDAPRQSLRRIDVGALVLVQDAPSGLETSSRTLCAAAEAVAEGAAAANTLLVACRTFRINRPLCCSNRLTDCCALFLRGTRVGPQAIANYVTVVKAPCRHRRPPGR